MPGELRKGVHMICPRCNKPTLEEREREGITIDICQECRGIWLDRGELERLIARAGQDLSRDTPVHCKEHDRHDHHESPHKDHSDGDRHGQGHGHHHRKRHWLAELFD